MVRRWQAACCAGNSLEQFLQLKRFKKDRNIQRGKKLLCFSIGETSAGSNAEVSVLPQVRVLLYLTQHLNPIHNR